MFFDPGTPGEFECGDFIVQEVSTNNNFLCVRVGEENNPPEEFDIGYAIKRVRIYEEQSY